MRLSRGLPCENLAALPLSAAQPLLLKPLMRATRAYTLIELMITIVLIGVLAALAVPSMVKANDDRLAYQDTLMVSELLRRARTTAVGRGAAMLVEISSDGTNDRGTFTIYESVRSNGNGVAGEDTPQPACRYPTDWTNATLKRKVAEATLNGQADAFAGIQTKLQVFATTTPTAYTHLYICFAPSGRTYLSTTLDFAGTQQNVAPVTVDVVRTASGTSNFEGIRRKVVLSAGGTTTIQLF